MSQVMQWYQLSCLDTGLSRCGSSAHDQSNTAVLHPEPCPPSLRGMAYGDGFFTTIGVYHAQALHLSYHQARVSSHCQALFIDLPQSAQDILWQTIKSKAADIQHGIIKIVVSRMAQPVRGYGHASDLQSNTALVWIGVTQTPPLASQQALFLDQQQGSHLSHSTDSVILRQPPITATSLTSKLASWPKPLAGLKSLNRLDGVMIAGELQRIKQAQPEIAEGLVQDMNGNWVEGVMSNVFYQLHSDAHDTSPMGQWYTPPIEHAGVNGTMRQAIMDRLDTLNKPVMLRALNDEDLTQVSSMFFCNAVRGVMPVEALILGGQRLELSLSVFSSNSVCK